MKDAAGKTRTATLRCEKHGEYAGEVAVLDFPWLSKEIPIDPGCPVCEAQEAAERKRREEEEERRSRLSRFRQMNIDERFHESGFENFDAYNAELLGHLKTCEAFAANPDGKLVMLGEHGNGKTHLAVSILKRLGGVIYKAFEIGINLRQSYNGGTKEHEVFHELCAAPLLVIDEVEKIRDSESKQNWMSYVIGKRYDRMLPVILIANCHVKSDCAAPLPPCPRCLEYHLENDVLSRIIEDGIVMKFNSDDYREKIRAARLGSKAR
jgi:DNA replication protein DnaC